MAQRDLEEGVTGIEDQEEEVTEAVLFEGEVTEEVRLEEDREEADQEEPESLSSRLSTQECFSCRATMTQS